MAFLDLHWATSEHSINALKVNMEAQLHHYNSWFDTYAEAVEHQGQTLALAVLFTVFNIIVFRSVVNNTKTFGFVKQRLFAF